MDGSDFDHDFDLVYDRTGSDSSKWHTFPPDVLPMYVADMDFRSPEPVIRALRERVEHGFFGYGRENAQLQEVVADRMLRRYGWRVDPDSVVTIPGVISGFNAAVRELAPRGSSVLIQTPAYPPILKVAANFGLERDEAPLRKCPDGSYEHDEAAFRSALRPSTRVFVLCNPHNPTGRVFDRAELESMAQACLDNDVLIASDEIHCDLVYEGGSHTPIASLSPEVEARTITFMAPSKTFNLPGLKFAIAIVPDGELRKRFAEGRGDLVKAVNVLGAAAGLAAYRDCDEWLAELLHYLDGNRQFVGDYLARHLPMIRYVQSEGTYLAWLDCGALPVENPREFFLAEGRVAFSDGAGFGDEGQGFVRLNFGCPRQLLEEGLGRIRKAVESLGLAGNKRLP